jgi:hypothetical protein
MKRWAPRAHRAQPSAKGLTSAGGSRCQISISDPDDGRAAQREGVGGRSGAAVARRLR